MLTPPPDSRDRTTQYYIDLGNGEVDPQNIINDIKHYEEQLNDLRDNYEKAIIARTKLTNECIPFHYFTSVAFYNCGSAF